LSGVSEATMKDSKWAMLCRLVAQPFDDPGWVWERKYDGDRMRVYVGGDGTELTARSGADKTAQFPELRFELPDCVKSCTLDGEVVSKDGLSFSEFNQRRMNRTKDVAKMAGELPAKFMAFDLLALDGEDMTGQPLAKRRHLLLLAMPCSMNMGTLEVVSQFDGGVDAFGRALEYGWEGVVGKRLGEPYLPHRRAWVKVKVWLPPKAYWVIGFTEGTGKRAGMFGAMMLGEWDEKTDDFRYVGDVGTGPTDAELARLDGLRRSLAPYKGMEFGHRIVAANYLTGMLKVRVKAVEVTNDGKLRFPVYIGQEG
jgi:bifunctional non-homologous end joining protein LigD